MQDRSTGATPNAEQSAEASDRRAPTYLKAVLLDAGDVIYRRRRNTPAVAAFLQRTGLRPPPYDAPELQALKRDAHAGRISREAFFKAVLKHCGPLAPDEAETGLKLLAAAQAEIDFLGGVPETLHKLKHAGLRLGIVTNTFDPTATKLEWFRRAGIDKIWDSFATSCELKLMKPKPGIYLAALSPLDIYPSQAAFVGHAQEELDGAKRLGMTTIAYNRDSARVTADYVIDEFDELIDWVRAG